MALFILGAVAVPLSYGMPTPANSSGVRADPRLCEALEAGLGLGRIVALYQHASTSYQIR
jgi:hypothetical protein